MLLVPPCYLRSVGQKQAKRPDPENFPIGESPSSLHRLVDWNAAEQMSGKGRESVLAAAKRYGEAFGYYERFLAELRREPPPGDLHSRARSPERIGVLTRLLEGGITAESAGLDMLERAVALLV